MTEEFNEITAETQEATPDKQSRWRSWALWLSVAGATSVIFSALGLWSKLGIDSEAFNAIVTAIGSILTAFGIVNNPTDKGGI